MRKVDGACQAPAPEIRRWIRRALAGRINLFIDPPRSLAARLRAPVAASILQPSGASAAEYVRMMSAPARLMPVRISRVLGRAGGYWRIFAITASSEGGMEHEKDHLNTLGAGLGARAAGCRLRAVLTRATAADFGGTFAGFFSDEPGFYNDGRCRMTMKRGWANARPPCPGPRRC